jgi:hypothetical protein
MLLLANMNTFKEFSIRSKAFFFTYSNLIDVEYSEATAHEYIEWAVAHYNTGTNHEERKIQLTFIVVGIEQHESGVPHLHAFMMFSETKRITCNYTVYFRDQYRPRIEAVRHIESTIKYCRKEGSYAEWGTPPTAYKGKKLSLPSAIEDIPLEVREARIANSSFYMSMPVTELVSTGCIPFQSALKHDKTQKMLQLNAKQTVSSRDLEVYWLYGPTAIGKSHYVRSQHAPEDLYIKSSTNKWWDGYTGQENVLLEEVEKADMDTDLKRWTDKYIFAGEVKGGYVPNICYKRIYLTSNLHPKELWKPQQTYSSNSGMSFNTEAIMRRLEIMTIVGSSIMIPFNERDPPQRVKVSTLEELELMKGTPLWVQYIPKKKEIKPLIFNLNAEQLAFLNNNKS